MDFPDAFGLMARELNGLILFTGGTGTGKTTSLATLLNQINHERAVHVITLEDPIEYIHEHGRATFNQRELGNDFSSYATGLRSALRQALRLFWWVRYVTGRLWKLPCPRRKPGTWSCLPCTLSMPANRLIGLYPCSMPPIKRRCVIDWPTPSGGL